MKRPIALVVVVLAAAGPAAADERKFTFSYEAKTLPEDTVEFEQWATLRARREKGIHHRYQFREEIEYGVTDRFTAALYLNWEYEAIRGIPGVDNEHEVAFETVSLEGKYKLLDPSADPVGALLYAEIGLGSEEQEVELKGILNKRISDFNLVYNLIVEFEREEEEEPNGEKEWERESLLSHTVGLSYQANPNVAIGMEGVTRQEFEKNFGEQEHLGYFVGPNLHVAVGEWWGTLTVLRQVDLRGEDHGLDLDAFDLYEVRLIVGIGF